MKYMYVACTSYLSPKRMPWSLDPFLEPLVTEFEDHFIDGLCA